MIAKLLISSSSDARVSIIEKELKKYSLAKTHPDLLYFEQNEKLGIAEARKIKEHFSLKPYSAKGRGVVLEDASMITVEAQNALLKTFEDLPKEALLILGASSDASFLPTILSRCQIVHLKPTASPAVVAGEASETGLKDIEKLLSANPEERFEYIEKLKSKDEFLHILILFFRQMLYAPRPRLGKLEATRFLKELLQSEQWARQNVNIRAILEYLMLVMPKKE